MVKLVGASPPTVVDPSQSYTIVIEEGIPGTKGDKGDKGDTGATGAAGTDGSTFSFHQSTPATNWIINTNLGKYTQPVVFLDSDPGSPVWTDITYVDSNNVLLSFPQAESGWAHF